MSEPRGSEGSRICFNQGEIGLQQMNRFKMDLEASVSVLALQQPDCTYFSLADMATN